MPIAQSAPHPGGTIFDRSVFAVVNVGPLDVLKVAYSITLANLV